METTSTLEPVETEEEIAVYRARLREMFAQMDEMHQQMQQTQIEIDQLQEETRQIAEETRRFAQESKSIRLNSNAFSHSVRQPSEEAIPLREENSAALADFKHIMDILKAEGDAREAQRPAREREMMALRLENERLKSERHLWSE